MTTHELKCWPMSFAAIKAGHKTVELRPDDRSPRFSQGDRLLLREWVPETESYTGEECLVSVLHRQTGFGLRPGFVALSIRPLALNRLVYECDDGRRFRLTYPVMANPTVVAQVAQAAADSPPAVVLPTGWELEWLEPRRLRARVEAWPECYTGGYDPRCCRFPKSCSATVYNEEHVTEEQLEPKPSGSQGSAEPLPHEPTPPAEPPGEYVPETAVREQ